MSLPLPAGAIFDMDGTLLDTERLLLAAMDAEAAARGWTRLGPAFRSVTGLRADLAAQHLSDALGGRAVFDDFARAVDLRRADLEGAGIPLKPNARSVLEALARQGVPMALATSTHTEQAEGLLRRSGLRGFFAVVIGGDRVTRPKPDPEIYRSAAAGLGLAPTACAAFEDSAPGTRSAHAAGCITVQIPDLAPPDADLRALGHAIAADLEEAARLVGLLPERA